jgi:hypothetical protein
MPGRRKCISSFAIVSSTKIWAQGIVHAEVLVGIQTVEFFLLGFLLRGFGGIFMADFMLSCTK